MSAGLRVTPLAALPDVLEIVPKRLADERGFFSELFNRRLFQEAGIAFEPVQTNHSYSVRKGTLRGLHFQAPPSAQAKLVFVPKGRILDVAADIRKGSPTFGKWAAAELSGEDGNQLLIPAGFAHGFLTLAPETHVQYMVTSHYAPADDRGIRWDDRDLAIAWPLAGEAPFLSPRDRAFPGLAEIDPPFAV